MEKKENTLASLSPSKFRESKPQKNREHSDPFLTHSEPLLTVQDEYKGPPPSHPLATSILKHPKVFSKVGLRKTTFKTKRGLFEGLIIFQPCGVKFPHRQWLSSKLEGKLSLIRGRWGRSIQAECFGHSNKSRMSTIISKSSRKEPYFVKVQNKMYWVHFSKTAQFCVQDT